MQGNYRSIGANSYPGGGNVAAGYNPNAVNYPAAGNQGYRVDNANNFGSGSLSGSGTNTKSIESYEEVSETQADTKELINKLNTDLITSVKKILNVFSTDSQLKPIIKSRYMKEVKGLISAAKNAQGVNGYLDMIGNNSNSSNSTNNSNSVNTPGNNKELEDKVNILSKQVTSLLGKLNSKNDMIETDADANNNYLTHNDISNHTSPTDFSNFNFKGIDSSS